MRWRWRTSRVLLLDVEERWWWNARWHSLCRLRCAPPVGVVGCRCGCASASPQATGAPLGICALMLNRLNVGEPRLSGTILIDDLGDCCCRRAFLVVLLTTTSVTGYAPTAVALSPPGSNEVCQLLPPDPSPRVGRHLLCPTLFRLRVLRVLLTRRVDKVVVGASEHIADWVPQEWHDATLQLVRNVLSDYTDMLASLVHLRILLKNYRNIGLEQSKWHYLPLLLRNSRDTQNGSEKKKNKKHKKTWDWLSCLFYTCQIKLVPVSV